MDEVKKKGNIERRIKVEGKVEEQMYNESPEYHISFVIRYR
jgi:hypothetical protein